MTEKILNSDIAKNNGGFLSQVFHKIVDPIQEYIEEVRTDLQNSRNIEEGRRQENIAYVYELAEKNVGEYGGDIERSIIAHMKMNKDHMNEYGKIRPEEVIIYGRRSTEEKTPKLNNMAHEIA